MTARRFRHGLVLGKFYPFHAGHSHLIRKALMESERVTVQVLGSSVESLSMEERADWIRQEHPTARIVTALDDAEVDFDSEEAWVEHMRVIEACLDEPVHAVFTSDRYGGELARRLGAVWVRIDPGRRENPISGRDIRPDVAASWHLLPSSTREGLVRRVVVLGAESTGSTTLARDLAQRFGTSWVPEYGREHSETRVGGLETPWRPDEFDLIVDRQIASEREAARRSPSPLLVCDTDVLATALWFERYLGTFPGHLLEQAAAHRPILYVLTGDEIPFVQDGLRDGEHIRHRMQQRFREVLAAQEVPWIEVHGDRTERTDAAAAAIAPALSASLHFSPPLEARGEDTDSLNS
jgi:NadR type nicotinamide-nucleotide adenylyltransferase